MTQRWLPAAAGLVLMSVTSTASAQLADSLASVTFELYPNADVGDTGERLRLNVGRASLGVPIQLTKRTTLFAGASYELLDIHPSDMDAFQLQAPKLTTGVIHGFSEHWGMMAFVDGGLASDFSDSVGSDDVLLSLTGVATYKVNESFSFGAGAVYDRRTGKLAPLPALLLNWSMSARARLRGFLPANVTAEYHATDWFDVGVRGTFEGNRFHLGQERFGVPGLELAYSTLTVGPKLTFSVSDWVHLDTYAAAAVYRRYQLFHHDESYAKYELAPVLAYGLRLRVGPSLWQASEASE